MNDVTTQRTQPLIGGEEAVPGPKDALPEMVWIARGEFPMGSDHHHRNERPAHRVRADGFRMDRTPITNRECSCFVQATRYVTLAAIPPDAKDYRPAAWCGAPHGAWSASRSSACLSISLVPHQAS